MLVLPSGCDSHFDVGMAVASGAKLVVYGMTPGGVWPDGLQETEYLRPSERLGRPAATEAAVDRAIAQGWLKP